MLSAKKAMAFAGALLVAATLQAQSTTGTISGHITDPQGLAVPGATVTLTSPALQGSRTAVTADNGDYILPLLPPGSYTVTVELSGFQSQSQNRHPCADAEPAGRRCARPRRRSRDRDGGRHQRSGARADCSSRDGFQAGPHRDPPDQSRHQCRPAHGSGGAADRAERELRHFRRLVVRQPVHGERRHSQRERPGPGGQPLHRGRSPGDERGERRRLSGVRSFWRRRRQRHHEVGRQHVQRLVPRHARRRQLAHPDAVRRDALAAAPGSKDPRIPKVVPQYEYTLGGRIVRDRLWFFTAGRWQTQESGRQLVATNIPYNFTNKTRRVEGKLTYSLTSNHKFQGSVTRNSSDQLNNTFNTSLSMDLRSLSDRQLPDNLWTVNYSGILSSRLFVEARVSQREEHFIGSGAKSTDLIDGTLLIDRQREQHALLGRHLLRRLHARGSQQRRRLREGVLVRTDQRSRFTHPGVRLRFLQRHPQGQQPPVRQRLPHPRHRDDYRRHG